jgi:hypothetical protein
MSEEESKTIDVNEGLSEDLKSVSINDSENKSNRTRSRSRSKLRAGYEEANELFDDGKFSEAFKKFEVVFQGRKSSLGVDHPETLEAKHKMGLALDSDGKYAEAFKIHADVYTGRKRVLGEGGNKKLF